MSTVTEATKRCSRCRQQIPLTDFGPDNRKQFGLASECRDCHAMYNHWRSERPPKNYGRGRKCTRCGCTIQPYNPDPICDPCYHAQEAQGEVVKRYVYITPDTPIEMVEEMLVELWGGARPGCRACGVCESLVSHAKNRGPHFSAQTLDRLNAGIARQMRREA